MLSGRSSFESRQTGFTPTSSGDTAVKQIVRSVRKFMTSEDGPTSVEYCFMLGFIILVCFTAIGLLGQTTHGLYVRSANELP